MKSDMQLVTAQFEGQANSLEALTAKDELLRKEIEQQEEKVRALTNAYQDSLDVYGEVDSRTDKYRQSLNRAKTELLNMQRELQDNSRYMDEARRSADKTADSIDEFGREAKDADNGLGKLNVGLNDLADLLAGGAVIAGVKGIADSMIAVVDATEEYRRIMGQLEVSSQAAGYTADQTAEAYNRLYGVLADPQATATTIANLQAIGLSQEDLMVLIDQVTGAWAKYGDSIPTDGLAEAINETISVGAATANFSDILTWAGVSEDAFNEKLGAANSLTERQNIVMQELARQGLAELAQGYRDANEATIKANEAQADYEAKQAEFAEKVLPFKTMLVELATGGWDVLTNSIQTAIDLWNQSQSLFSKESELRKNGLIVSHEDRMAAYGYEAYYTEDGLLRYRQAEVADQLVTANVTEPRSGASDAVLAEAASALNALRAERSAQGGGHFMATVTLATEDGRNLGQFVTPFVNEENAANPPVRSDDV